MSVVFGRNNCSTTTIRSIPPPLHPSSGFLLPLLHPLGTYWRKTGGLPLHPSVLLLLGDPSAPTHPPNPLPRITLPPSLPGSRALTTRARLRTPYSTRKFITHYYYYVYEKMSSMYVSQKYSIFFVAPPPVWSIAIVCFFQNCQGYLSPVKRKVRRFKVEQNLATLAPHNGFAQQESLFRHWMDFRWCTSGRWLTSTSTWRSRNSRNTVLWPVLIFSFLSFFLCRINNNLPRTTLLALPSPHAEFKPFALP